MAFDQRSRQRLEELGRRLPQPLPVPQPAQQEQGRHQSASRHRIETETDPEVLFGELMQASPDGSVPPHLLDRLRQLEQQRPKRIKAIELSSAPAAASSLQRKSSGRQDDPLYVEFEQMLLEDDEN